MHSEIHIQVHAATWEGGGVPTALARARRVYDCPVLSSLLYTALLTRPPAVEGFHLSDVWAWMRYGPALASSKDLRLRPEWEQVDPHQKTILSDDFGLGFTGFYVASRLGVSVFADTRYVLSSLYPNAFTLNSTNKRGPDKAPDYVGMLKPHEFVVLECKGTQTSRSTLAGQLDDGISQKEAIHPTANNSVRESLVAGIFVPQHSNKEKALLRIRDPQHCFAEIIEKAEPEQVARAIMKTHMSSALALTGFPETATALAKAPLSQGERVVFQSENKRGFGPQSEREEEFVPDANTGQRTLAIYFPEQTKMFGDEPVRGIEATAAWEPKIWAEIRRSMDLRELAASLAAGAGETDLLHEEEKMTARIVCPSGFRLQIRALTA
mgnify:CR=1 FL=1